LDINVNVNLNRVVASNRATIMELANQTHASFEEGRDCVSARRDVHAYLEDPSWTDDTRDRDRNAII
jgi:hypothetical protein